MKKFIKYMAVMVVFTAQSVWASVDIQNWHTKNGTKVLFVPANELPMLDIEISFDAGSARDGDAYGLASFTAGMVGTQTSTLNEDEISENFNMLGAQFGGGAGRDKASFSLRTLTREELKKQAIDQFATVMSDAQFSEEIFKREQQRLIMGLQQKAVKPDRILNDTLWQTLYGSHPYGHETSGTIATVEKLNIDKIKKFYSNYYVAKNAVIAMVGDIDRKEAEKIAEQLSSKLPTGKKAIALKAPKPMDKGQEIVKEFDSTQTYFAMAQLGVERGHPDYIPLFVGNHLFGGGGFGSYLMEEVREKRGLVYSVYSYFSPHRQTGPFVIGLSTKNASAREAQQVVKETLLNFLKDVPQERLDASKSNLVGGFPLRIDSNSKKLGYLSMIGFYDMPLDYLEWFPSEVEKVTKKQVLEAWNRLIQPEKMLTIMVGKPE